MYSFKTRRFHLRKFWPVNLSYETSMKSLRPTAVFVRTKSLCDRRGHEAHWIIVTSIRLQFWSSQRALNDLDTSNRPAIIIHSLALSLRGFAVRFEAGVILYHDWWWVTELNWTDDRHTPAVLNSRSSDVGLHTCYVIPYLVYGGKYSRYQKIKMLLAL